MNIAFGRLLWGPCVVFVSEGDIYGKEIFSGSAFEKIGKLEKISI